MVSFPVGILDFKLQAAKDLFLAGFPHPCLGEGSSLDPVLGGGVADTYLVPGMTKIKMSKDEGVASEDFVERRRAALERFLQRTAQHPSLRVDPDFREFLELEAELPRATSTAALSGAGMFRLISRVGDSVSKITTKMDETDPVSGTSPRSALCPALRSAFWRTGREHGMRRRCLVTETFVSVAEYLSSNSGTAYN